MDDEYFGEDVVTSRAALILSMAATLENLVDDVGRDYVIKTMDALLYGINPKRGEVVKIK